MLPAVTSVVCHKAATLREVGGVDLGESEWGERRVESLLTRCGPTGQPSYVPASGPYQFRAPTNVYSFPLLHTVDITSCCHEVSFRVTFESSDWLCHPLL